MDPLAYLDLKLPLAPSHPHCINDACGDVTPAHVPWPTANSTTLRVIAAYLNRLETFFTPHMHCNQPYTWTYDHPHNGSFTLEHSDGAQNKCVLLRYNGEKLNGCDTPFYLHHHDNYLQISGFKFILPTNQQFLMWHANMLIDLVHHLHSGDSAAASWIKSRLPLSAQYVHCVQPHPPALPPTASGVDHVAATALTRLLNFFAANGADEHAIKTSHTASDTYNRGWNYDAGTHSLEFFAPDSDTTHWTLDGRRHCIISPEHAEPIPFPYTFTMPTNASSLSSYARDLEDNLQLSRHGDADATDADARAGTLHLLTYASM